MIAITEKGELIPIKRGQSLTGMGFLGIIITNPDDLADDEHGLIGCRFSQPDSEKLCSEILHVLHGYKTYQTLSKKLSGLLRKLQGPSESITFQIKAFDSEELKKIFSYSE